VVEGSPTVRRRRLGLVLRDLRERAGYTGETAAQALERSASWISRIEAGYVRLRTRDLHDLFDLYQLVDEARRAELEQLAKEGQARGWWSRYRDALPDTYARYIGLEDEAQRIFAYDNTLVPGLLQTEEYARAVHALTVPAPISKHVESRVRVRMKRQEILMRKSPPAFDVVLDEAVLRRAYGGPHVLRNQLDRLLEAGAEPHVEIRVVPLQRGDQVVTGSFAMLDFPNDRVVYIETANNCIMLYGPDADAHRQAADRIRAVALDPVSTLELIRGALRNIAP
jgi:transcriptional regulator with XRE-family HTH domain